MQQKIGMVITTLILLIPLSWIDADQAKAMCAQNQLVGTWLNENRYTEYRQFLEVQQLCFDTIDSPNDGSAAARPRPANYYIHLFADECEPDQWCSEGRRAAGKVDDTTLQSITDKPAVYIFHELRLIERDRLRLRQVFNWTDPNRADEEYIEHFVRLSFDLIDRIPEGGPYPGEPKFSSYLKPKTWLRIPPIDCAVFPCPYFIAPEPVEETVTSSESTVVSSNLPPTPQPVEVSLEERLVTEVDRIERIPLNGAAALLTRILQDGLMPTSDEVLVRFQETTITLQRAESHTSRQIRVYYAKLGEWWNIQTIDPTQIDQSSFAQFVLEEAQKAQVVRLNDQAAVQRAIFADNFIPTSAEFPLEVENAFYMVQRAENPYNSEVRVYYVKAPLWQEVRFIVKSR